MMFARPDPRTIRGLGSSEQVLPARTPRLHHTPYLSPSRLMLYEACPALYRRRYVLGVVDPPTIDMEYGQVIHRGLEVHFSGGDGHVAFLQELEARLQPLREQGVDPADWLAQQGIKLLDRTIQLGYVGLPEHKFFAVLAGFSVPFRGVVDLWCPTTGLVVDWKTTRAAWSEKTAARYAYQRVIYSYVMAEQSAFDQDVRFQFVVLGAYPGGGVQVIEATPEPGEMAELFDHARQIAARIEAEDWACTCRGSRHEEQVA